MLPTLLGGYLTASAPPLPTPTAIATPTTRLPPRLRPSTRLVARRSAGETVHATAAEEEEQEWKELEEEGLPRRGRYGEQDDHDHDPEIGDIMGDYFDDPKKAQSRVSTGFSSSPRSSMPALSF
jgi:hypothetical protein